MSLIWLLVSLGYCLACHRRYVNDMVRAHFDHRTTLKCKGSGQPCKFDRNCCAGMECKMDIRGFDIIYRCQYRKIYENYVEITDGPVWKDYQELESDEDGLKKQDVEELAQRNEELRKKLGELETLRKSVRHQQLKDTKRKLEDAEIEELKDEQQKYEEKSKLELDRLKAKELEDLLTSLEKKEVNHTLSKQQRVADLYMNMLSDLVDKEGIINKLNA